MTTIKRIEKLTAGEQVYQNLRENIVAHHWQINERLPSETELATLYGVNRLTVRMALQRLNAIGLVETRIGDGTYVKKFDFSDYINAVQDLYSNPALMADVCEFRKLLELECARLAMDRATDEEFQELNQICSDYEKLKSNILVPVSDDNLRELTNYDIIFHEKICLMSHNTLYKYCFTMAKNTIEKYIFLNLKKRISTWEERGISIIEGDYRHRAILNSIKNHNFEECKKLYDDMIDFNIIL